MDKQDIRRHLIQITEEEIPDVNLLPEIQKQLQKQYVPSTRMVFTFARASAIFVFLLTVSAVLSYAYYQNTLIPSTIPEDLVTQLNMEQTIEDMTVTLNWAYADEYRMALEFTSTYDALVTSSGNSRDVILQTADGIIIPQPFSGGGGGGGSDSVTTTNSHMASYYTIPSTAMLSTIDLVLIVRYHNEEMSDSHPNTDSWGESPNTNIIPDSVAPDREFIFEFSLPMLSARSGELVEAIIISEDNSIMIQNVRVTPSMTVFELCSPLINEGWLPYVVLQTNQPLPEYLQNVPIAIALDGTIGYPSNNSDIQIVEGRMDCSQMTIPAPFTAETGELTIIVEKFYRHLEEDIIEAIEADIVYFAELGFEVSYEIVAPPVIGGLESQFALPISTGEMMIIIVESYPDAITQSVANSYVGSNSLQERITGEWVFTVIIE